MKWPWPALLPSLLCLLIAGVIGIDEKEIPKHPPTPVKAVQQQTSQVVARQSATVASQQPPKPAPKPQTNVPLASPTASQGVTHTPPQRFDSRGPSVVEPQRRERSELRPPAESTQSGLPVGFFTVGSLKADVLRAQGTPTEFSESVWKYGSSSVFFNNGRLVRWDIWPGAPLRARMLPTEHVDASVGYFTVGSTKDEVLAVQGTPTEFGESIWKYGSSSVFFNNGRVVRWDIWPGAPLRARMLPAEHVDAGVGYFTVGSTKDEVLAVQGTPTEFSESVWKYGSSSVFFNNGRVVRWDIWPGAPLRVRMPKPEP